VDQVCCNLTGHSTPDPEKILANISDTVYSTPDPQETLANISDIVHSTPDPQQTVANISDTIHNVSLMIARVSCGSGVL
jgi:hypothetical protein